ncbi:MAG: transglycosylase SLT domain-containing protein [Deltaproteobacteria bacterium]|nr:transglycosylase SLT domain-containing protein [Deltaproteobacteria bacterium]
MGARTYGAVLPRWLGITLLVGTWHLAGCSAYRVNHTAEPFLAEYAAGPAAAEPPQFSLARPSLPESGSAAQRSRADQFSVSHPRVDDYVTSFQTDSRGFYQRALNRGSRYLPRMERVLREENVPTELAYLPLIESGFRTHAVSRAGAVGPWQFIRATGRRYGLRIDGYVDERRDPVKATRAAARYLKDLYAQFGDWHLSLAAYNTGEMHIQRELNRGRAEDYWEMSERGYLARETCNFVPQFLAALQIAQDPTAYGFEQPPDEPLQYDLVRVSHSVPLKTVAKITNTSVDQISELNPALHRGVTPPQGYTVRVPKGTKDIVEVALARMRHDARQVVAAPLPSTPETYKLRKGDSLAAVAKRHGVSLTALLKANRIRDARRVAAGRVLRLPAGARSAKVAAPARAPQRLAARRAR